MQPTVVVCLVRANGMIAPIVAIVIVAVTAAIGSEFADYAIAQVGKSAKVAHIVFRWQSQTPTW